MKPTIKFKKDFSVIILAAGKSERLGFPKLSLKFDECNTFIEYIIHEYLQCCKEIIVVVNESSYGYLKGNKVILPDEVKIVINEYPEWHRFYSLKLGVQKLSEKIPVVFHNVDNPFVNKEVLNKLMSCLDKAQYIIPEHEGRSGHPVLLSANIVKDIASTKENKLHLKEFLNQYSKQKVSVDDEKVLVNINTIEDYNKYFQK